MAQTPKRGGTGTGRTRPRKAAEPMPGLKAGANLPEGAGEPTGSTLPDSTLSGATSPVSGMVDTPAFHASAIETETEILRDAASPLEPATEPPATTMAEDPSAAGAKSAHPDQPAEMPAAAIAESSRTQSVPPPYRGEPARASLLMPIAAGAIAGAIVGALVALIVPSLKGRSQVNDLNALAQRVSSLERALGGADADKVQAISTTLADVQKRLDGQKEAMTALNASTTGAIAALKQASAASASEAVASVSARMQKLEQSDQALTGSLKNVSSGQSANIGAALLAATQALASSFERGAPLAQELRAVESLSRKPEALAPLRAYEGTGAPTQAALAAQLAALRPALLSSEVSPSGNGVLDRLAASAGSLVKVRPVGEQAGTDTASIASRMEAAMQRGDAAAAVKESAALSPKAAAVVQPWLDRVKSRLAAVAAIRGLENDALGIITESRK